MNRGSACRGILRRCTTISCILTNAAPQPNKTRHPEAGAPRSWFDVKDAANLADRDPDRMERVRGAYLDDELDESSRIVAPREQPTDASPSEVRIVISCTKRPGALPAWNLTGMKCSFCCLSGMSKLN